MNDSFYKFPSTPHLTTLEGMVVRGDKVMSKAEQDDFLLNKLIVEEKVDGANLGISFDSEGSLLCQNRGSYLSFPAVGQWKKLAQWLEPKLELLLEILTDRYILFGEWCYAQHSVHYNHLPDWFLAFDIFDKHEEKFLSISHRNKLLERMEVTKVPQLAHGHFSLSEIELMLAQSKISGDPAEGLYLRADNGQWLMKRAKLVRSSFIQSVEKHWSRSSIKPNKLAPTVWEGQNTVLDKNEETSS
ncbi:RNA ligase family protein [Pontiellaceae bacterium B1224]|nr:RNA ligase family protein [Pontiellaceae bacterium B1224]